MTLQTYKINGMTCNSCVEKITKKISEIPGVAKVEIDLVSQKANIDSVEPVSLLQLRLALEDLPKYSADYADNTVEPLDIQPSFVQTYKPLITVFIFILFVSLAYQKSLPGFSGHLFMRHLMAGFFISLSFFKFLDLKGFSQSFANYDPVAKTIRGYGKLYPFIEFTIGLMFIAGVGLTAANLLTIILLSVTTFGVVNKITAKSQIRCACLGAAFDLPLSWVTVAENVLMVLMAIYSLFIK